MFNVANFFNGLYVAKKTLINFNFKDHEYKNEKKEQFIGFNLIPVVKTKSVSKHIRSHFCWAKTA